MSGHEIITCFNKKECTYDATLCPLFDVENDWCKLERLKTGAKAAPPRRTQPKKEGFPPLEAGKYIPKLSGEIVSDITVREVETERGPSIVANFKLSDGNSDIRVAIWGDLVNEIQEFGKGKQVTLTGMSVKPPYENVTQVSSTRKTIIN